MDKVGLGGGCHWCTEGIFQSLNGVIHVEQGWIQSFEDHKKESEAVIVHYNPRLISLEQLIEIHLNTHACTADHSMRTKYRSAIYVFNKDQEAQSQKAIEVLQNEFEREIITLILPLGIFRLNEEKYLNYYKKNPEAPFCETYISPKLKLLKEKFGNHLLVEDLKS